MELGRFRLYPLSDGFFRLDGGSLFGIVPRTLWSKNWPPDERNRVQLGIRPLLVEAGSKWILIDTGIGDKFESKLNEIYGIERAPKMEDQLQQIGVDPKDIHIVINTHLHWDHAGGNTIQDASGNWKPFFPNARYVVQRGEYEFAMHLNERTKGSYRVEDYAMLKQEGLFDFADGDTTVCEGVKVLRSGGHVPYHQCVLLESDSRKAFFLGDLIPTHHHLPFPYIMGFDLEPLITLEKKKEYLAKAAEEDWLIFFVHDPRIPFGRIELKNGSYQLKD